jgi:hypothetical protein
MLRDIRELTDQTEAYASMDPRAVEDTVTLRRGRQLGYSRAKIVDADRPERVLALIEGQGISIASNR